MQTHIAPFQLPCMTEVPDDAQPALDVLKSVGGDGMVAMLMRTFVQFADERVAKLVDEAAYENWDEVASIAHALKSSARQLGANALSDSCAGAEEAGRSGEATATLAGVAAIQREYRIARAWMRNLVSPAS